MKPKSKRKSTSPRKVKIKYNKINLTKGSIKLRFLNTVTFSLNMYQGKPSHPRKPRRKQESRQPRKKGENQVLRRYILNQSRDRKKKNLVYIIFEFLITPYVIISTI